MVRVPVTGNSRNERGMSGRQERSAARADVLSQGVAGRDTDLVKPPRLPPGYVWLTRPKEIGQVLGGYSEVNLHWLGRQPPHSVPLAARWRHAPGYTGPIDVWVGAVSTASQAATLEKNRIEVLAQLNQWIDNALAATPGWKSQNHQIEWRVLDRMIELVVDLDPRDHRA